MAYMRDWFRMGGAIHRASFWRNCLKTRKSHPHPSRIDASSGNLFGLEFFLVIGLQSVAKNEHFREGITCDAAAIDLDGLLIHSRFAQNGGLNSVQFFLDL